MNEDHNQQSPKKVIEDIIVSLMLVSGSGIIDRLGSYLFPSGLPTLLQIVMFALDIATFSWALSLIIRYFGFVYREVNLLLISISKSKTWKLGKGFFNRSLVLWRNLDKISRIIVLLIFLTGSCFMVYMDTGSLFDLIFPPLYWSLCFGVTLMVEFNSNGKFKAGVSFWLILLLVFIVITILLIGDILLVDSVYYDGVTLNVLVDTVLNRRLIVYVYFISLYIYEIVYVDYQTKKKIKPSKHKTTKESNTKASQFSRCPLQISF